MGATSVSRKKCFILAAVAAIIAVLLAAVIAPAQAHAVDNVSYIERYWSGTMVVSTPRTANNCFSIDDDTTVLEDGAWYVVNSNVDSNKRLVVKGTANIILCDGVKLTLDDGINVPAGHTLNIYGQGGNSGELYCHADTNDNAAIGADDQKGDCGTINIHGGKVTADTKTKGTDGAGIGGGDEGNGGDVTIYAGEVTAIGGEFGAGIGGGDRDSNKGGDGGTTRIYGGIVNATGGNHGAGIGGGELGSGGTVIIEGGKVTAQGGTDSAGIGGGQSGSGGTITINGGIVNATGGSASSNGGAGIGGGGKGSSGTIRIIGGEVTAQGGANAAGIGGGDEGGVDTITILGDKVKATGGSQNGDGGAGIGGGNERGGGEITIYGGEVIVQGGADAAGIGGGDAGAGGTVIVFNGTVNTTGGKYGAGIGGGQGQSGGTTKILGGSVTAQGGEYGAGIGGGQSGDGGTIEVDGGTVNATGGTDSAGIGGGEDGDGGTINIKRGNVTANGTTGGAGIGGGDGVGVTEAGNSGNITISGGTVNATGGAKGAGIGGGNSGDSGNSGTISISGGTVIANGGGEDPEIENPKGAAAIGGGNAQSGGTIQITGGDVTAKASYRSAGIGGGGEASGGNITITGGTVKAYGGAQGKHYAYIYPEGGAGIGGGFKNDGGTITIGGDASVTARGTEGAAGIGGGREGKSGTIVINGGTVDASTGHGGAGIGSGFICRASGTTVNVTINGGTVKAVGGESLLQTDAEVGKYFWSHPGAGIGAGGCSDYMQKEDREYHSYFTGSINLNGGTIDAFAGNNDVGLSNAVIGGIELRDTATITVKGGCTVKVHAGSSLMKASEVKLVDADGYSSCVRNLNNTSEIASTDQRVAWCKGENGPSELLIEPCRHEGGSYTDNGDTHSVSCPHCGRNADSDDHTYGEPTWSLHDNDATAKLTWRCACGHSKSNSLTIAAPLHKEYGDGEDAEAIVTDDPANPIRGGAQVEYYRSGGEHWIALDPITTAPEDAGDYKAAITLGTGSNSATAYVMYTIDRADCPANITEAATMKAGDNLDLENYVERNGATGKISCEIVGEAPGCSIEGSTLKTTSAAHDTVTVRVTIAEHGNYKSKTVDVKVTITEKMKQTLAAEDVTVTYGDTGKFVSASVIDPATGGGEISYAVKAGGEDYLEVNSSTGELTIKKAGVAYVTVTAAQTTDYAEAVEDIKVTIGKASSSPAGVAAVTGLVYDGTERQLVTVEGEASGGAMRYALGTETEATEVYSASLPVAADAGPHYVWCKVEGDENHNDSEPQCVEVTIGKKPVTASVKARNRVYNGTDVAAVSATVPAADVVEGDTVEVSGLKGTFSDANVGDDKTVTIDATGMALSGEGSANYEVSLAAETTASILPRPITVVADDKSKAYGESDPEFTARVFGAAEGSAPEYSLSRDPGENVGEYDIAVTPGNNPNYDITCESGKLTITGADLSVTATGWAGTYDGEAHSIAVTVEPESSGAKVYYATEELTAENYETAGSVDPVTRTDAGTTIVHYYVFAPNYGAVAGSADVVIEAADIAETEVTLAEASYTYDGEAKEPTATVTFGGAPLAEGTDYEVSYENNVEVGEATAIVSGLGNFQGSVGAPFEICVNIEQLGELKLANGRQQTWVAGERREISVAATNLALENGEVVTRWTWEYSRTPGDEVSWTRSGASTVADGASCAMVIPECTKARKAPMAWRATAITSLGRMATSEPQSLADLEQLSVVPDPEGDFAWVLGKDVTISAKVTGLAPGEEIERYQWYYSTNGKTFKKTGAKAAQPAADTLTLSGFKCTEARKAPMAWNVHITTTEGRTAISDGISLVG